MNIGEMAKKVHMLACEKGWHNDDLNVDEFINIACNNLHGEVTELHDAWRENRFEEPCDKAEGMKECGLRPLTCAEEELADIIICAMDDAIELGIDIEEAVLIKHEYNKIRPYRHGGKRG